MAVRQNLHLGKLIPFRPAADGERASNKLMIDDMPGAKVQIEGMSQQSEFIDCPSGDINMIIKKISTNNQTIFSDNNYVTVQMCSLIEHDKIMVDVSNKKDFASSLPMTDYSNKPSREDGNNNILVNHVANLVSRHHQDYVKLSILQSPK